MSSSFYPLILQPACYMRAWGSQVLSNYFPIPAGDDLPGEVYLAMDVSEVSNGEMAGTTLSEIGTMGAAYMGRRRATDGFPLRIKVFATGEPLTLQVHPSDTSARQNKLTTNFKAWYAIASSGGCRIHAELKADYTRQQLLSRLGSSKILESVNSFDLIPGDSYYLPSGRIHGVDAGAVMLAIEQNNPTTFVLGDGNHCEYEGSTPIDGSVAGQYINFNDRTLPRTVRDQTRDETRNRKITLVNTNPHFSLEELRLVNRMHHRTGSDSYHFLIPVDGDVEVSIGKESVTVPRLHACFIPAKSGFYNTTPSAPTRVIRVS